MNGVATTTQSNFRLKSLVSIELREIGQVDRISHDELAVYQFLNQKAKKPATHKAFLRDFRKLAIYMEIHQVYRLRDINASVCQGFNQFLFDPPKALLLSENPKDPHQFRFEKFISEQGHLNPSWRPFQKPQSVNTAIQTNRTLQCFWQWMEAEKIIDNNPWLTAIEKLKPSQTPTTTENKLTQNPIPVIRQYLAQLTPKNVIEQYRQAQQRWLFHLYLKTGCRANTCSVLTVNDIRVGITGHAKLTIPIITKNRRTLTVPWDNQDRRAFRIYLNALDIDKRVKSNPGKKNPTHLLLSEKSPLKDEAISYDTILRVLKTLLCSVSRWEDAPKFLSIEDLSKLEHLSPRYLAQYLPDELTNSALSPTPLAHKEKI